MPSRLAYSFLAALFFPVPALWADLAVTLTPSVDSPAPVGTAITWTATPGDGGLWYRFSTRGTDSGRKIVKDFGPDSTFVWAPYEREGLYRIEVEVRHPRTGETGRAAVPFRVNSNAVDGKAVVRPTVHPLVFLYSAPPCKAGEVAVVYFVAASGGALDQTPTRICDGISSMNFLVAGMRPETRYLAKHVVYNAGGFVDNPILELTTRELPADLPVHRRVSGITGSPSHHSSCKSGRKFTVGAGLPGFPVA